MNSTISLADTNTAASQWREASSEEPCPVCSKPDWCALVGPEGDPEAVVCMRVESGNQRGNGGWLHQLRKSPVGSAAPRQKGSRSGNPKKYYLAEADAIKAAERIVGREHSRRWEYREDNGVIVGYTLRWDATASEEKTIRPLSLLDLGWTIGAMPAPRPLLHLPELLDANEVLIVEGEKCVDSARSIGLVATTWCGGSSSVDKTNWRPLSGKCITIWPDNDEPGRKAASRIAQTLLELDPPAEVRIVEPPAGLPEKSDIADWLELHDAVEPDALRELFASLPTATPTLAPPKAKSPARSKSAGARPQLPLTDLGNGERFARQHRANVRHIYSWGKWLVWNGSRWEADDSGEIMRLAKSTAMRIYDEISIDADEGEQKAIAAWALASQSATKLRAMVDLARSERPIPISHDSLDADPWLLNCENGTVDLRTGELRSHDRKDLLTKTTGVECQPEAGDEPVLWLKFLNEIFANDQDLITYIRRVCGLCLIGEVLEHMLLIFHGSGANGKSVFVETIMAAMGDYAMKAPAGLMMASRGERHPTELADFHGKRLVTICETGDGQRLDERLLKEVTGGDTIRARRMREDFWQFTPSHSTVLVTNHKPVVRGTDYGIWRRLRLIPFTVTIPLERQDKQLPKKLRDELPLILRWMVQGCLEYQKCGLHAPACVMAATETYKQDSDTFATWFNESMELVPDERIKSSIAWSHYQSWAEENRERPIGRKTFGQRMEEASSGRHTSNGVWYLGVRLADNPES